MFIIKAERTHNVPAARCLRLCLLPLLLLLAAPKWRLNRITTANCQNATPPPLPLLKGGHSLVMFCVFSVRFRFLSLPRVAASCVFYSRRLTRINNTSFVIYVPEDIVFIFHATRSDSRLELGPELPPPPPPGPVSCPSHGSFAETISSLCVRLQTPLHCCFAVVVSLSLALPVSLTLGISTLYL